MAKKTNTKTGRPTKYKAEYCDRLIKFFDKEPYVDVEIDHYDKSGKKDEDGNRIVVWTDIKRMPNKLPTLRDFAKSIKVGISTVYDWIDEKHSSYQKEFSDAFTRVKDIRKWFLIQNGLQGLYNPIFAKFTAINVSDMRDSKDFQVSTGAPRKDMPTDDGYDLDETIKRLRKKCLPLLTKNVDELTRDEQFDLIGLDLHESMKELGNAIWPTLEITTEAPRKMVISQSETPSQEGDETEKPITELGMEVFGV